MASRFTRFSPAMVAIALLAGVLALARAPEGSAEPTPADPDKSPALCAEGDENPEPGRQGDVPSGTTANWDCGVRPVGFLAGAAGAMTVAYPCAYTGGSDGVRVIDVSDPTAPRLHKTLTDTGSRELLGARVAEDRAVLATRRRASEQQPDPADGRVLGKDMYVDIWDIGNCLEPVLKGTLTFPTTDKVRGDPAGETGGPAHNLGLSPDARKVYGTIPLDEGDISNLDDPSTWTVRRIQVVGGTHEPTFNPSGSRLYVGGQIPNSIDLTILDMENRDENGDPTVVSATEQMPGHSIDYATIDGRTYLLHSNEIGGTACIPEDQRPRYVGMGDRAWFLDITDETAPVPVEGGMIMMADSKFDNCGLDTEHTGVNTGGPSLAYHHIDDPFDSTYAILGYGSAGFRFFDIRDPSNPREVAYFNRGTTTHTKPYIMAETGQIWVSGAGGFWVLELEPQVRQYLGLDGPDLPPSKEACKEGGWQNYTDDQGRPFANQGDCVSFVAGRSDAGARLADTCEGCGGDGVPAPEAHHHHDHDH